MNAPVIRPAAPPPRQSQWSFWTGLPHLLRDRAEAFRKISAEHGPVVRVPVPGKPIYLVSDPHLVRQVLLTGNKNYGKSFDWKIVASLLGRGLVTSHDREWSYARKATSKMFTAAPVRFMVPAMARIVDDEIQSWADHGEELNTHRAAARLGQRVFSCGFMGVEADDQIDTIMGCVDVALKHLDRRLESPVDYHAWLPTFSRRRFERALATLDDIVYGWIDERAADPDGGRDLIRLLLRAAQGLPEGVDKRLWVRDHVTTFLIAGYETVSVALTWTLHLLSRHPEEQARVRAEVASLPDHPSAEALDALPVTDRALNESMRLYPPIWCIGRESREADRLGDYLIPPKSTVVLCTYTIQRDERLWPEPDAFKPERFQTPPDPSAGLTFFPFSSGPRFCTGERIAIYELRLALAAILRRFEVLPVVDGPVRREALISLRPKGSLPLRLKPLA